ncbi:MAG: type II secretion system major pseudopilin GspG [Pseudomonadota bacterium]
MPQQPLVPRTKDAGFTLLELLVVVTILVFLTVAVGSVALNYLGRARADAAQIQMTQIATGLDLFRLDVGRYPTTQEGLEGLITAPSGVDRWAGPYVKDADVLSDPWGVAFSYQQLSATSFTMMSLGADGTPGGEGDEADIKL